MKRWQFYADARTAELRAALSTPATFAGLQLHWAHNAEVWKQKRPTIYEHLAWPATVHYYKAEAARYLDLERHADHPFARAVYQRMGWLAGKRGLIELGKWRENMVPLHRAVMIVADEAA